MVSSASSSLYFTVVVRTVGDNNALFSRESLFSKSLPLLCRIAEHESYLNLHRAWNDVSVESRGTVFPFLDSLDRRGDKHRMSTHDMYVYDLTLRIDGCFQNDNPLNPGCSRQGRIHGHRFLNEHCRLDMARGNGLWFNIRVPRWWFRRSEKGFLQRK